MCYAPGIRSMMELFFFKFHEKAFLPRFFLVVI